MRGAEAAPLAVGDPAPAPPPLRGEDEIVSGWPDGPPAVSCVCHTYNHAPFIEDALRGMLGQVTSFPFEVILHDDASGDGTADVVRDFAARYPRIVRPILQSKNQYAVRKPSSFTLPAARGEFVAWCEGDDYWVDPRKLERQVARLRADPGAVMSHHDAVRIEDGRVLAPSMSPRWYHVDLSSRELQEGPPLPTPSWFFRRAGLPSLDFLDYCRTPVSQDKFFLSVLGLRGGSAFASDVRPAAYRHHGGGVWTTQSRDQRRITAAQTCYWLHLYHRDRSGARGLADHFLAMSVKRLAGSPASGVMAAWGWLRNDLTTWIRSRRRGGTRGQDA
jgi:glycosyltransferase involved in cell wall biosynthesis